MLINHGGTEMGQGLHTKIAQIVAEAFNVGLDRIKVTKTTTEKVPNTSATAAAICERSISRSLVTRPAPVSRVTSTPVTPGISPIS